MLCNFLHNSNNLPTTYHITVVKVMNWMYCYAFLCIIQLTTITTYQIMVNFVMYWNNPSNQYRQETSGPRQEPNHRTLKSVKSVFWIFSFSFFRYYILKRHFLCHRPVSFSCDASCCDWICLLFQVVLVNLCLIEEVERVPVVAWDYHFGSPRDLQWMHCNLKDRYNFQMVC